MDPVLVINEIPPHETKYLGKETLRAVERFFAIPGTQEKYEQWLKEYSKRKKTAGRNAGIEVENER